MKKILLIMLSIMFVILSCKTATNPIDSQRNGKKYVSAKPVNGSSYLAIAFNGTGGFELYYSDAGGNLPTGGKKIQLLKVI